MEYKLLLVFALRLQNCKVFLSAAAFCRRCVFVLYVKKNKIRKIHGITYNHISRALGGCVTPTGIIICSLDFLNKIAVS